MTRFDDQTPIPSASLTNNDADQLARLVALGKTEIKVALDCGFNGMYTSQNVIGEITGSKHPDEVVLIGAQGDDAISCEAVAHAAGTIPYEILTGLNARIPREYVGRASSGGPAA